MHDDHDLIPRAVHLAWKLATKATYPRAFAALAFSFYSGERVIGAYGVAMLAGRIGQHAEDAAAAFKLWRLRRRAPRVAQP